MHTLISQVKRFAVLNFFSLTTVIALLASFTSSGTLWAEETRENTELPDQRIEEIVVTARKREEALQGIAGSAAALNTGFLDDIGGIADLRELTDHIVGMTITEGQFPEVAEPSIRGAGQARNRMSVSATGVYRDGAYIAGKGIFGRNFAPMDSFDLRQVEVFRGPQGAAYGRNSMGGAIHLVSQTPRDEFSTEFSTSVGQNDMFSYQAIVNAPITETLATRFSYVNEESDGGFYTGIDGDPVDTSTYDHLRASVKFTPGDWVFTYMFDHMDSDGTPYIGINPREPVRAANNFDNFQTLINTTHRNWNRVDNHNLRVSYGISAGTFYLTSNYRDRDAGWQRDSDHDSNTVALATREINHNNDTTETLTFHELRFDSTSSNNMIWSLGADYYASDTTESILVYNPALIAATIRRFDDPLGTTYDSFMEIDQKSWSVFGMLEYGFSSIPLTLSGELRYARDDLDGLVEIYQPYQGCARTLNLSPCTLVDDGSDYTNLPWNVTAKWDLQNLPDVITGANFYAKVGSSYRHGGLNLSAGLPSNAYLVKPTYGEETAMVYELGMKSSWFEDRMLLNVSVFSTDYEDFLNTTTNGCPDLCPYLDPVTFQPLGYNPDGSRIEVNADGEAGQESGIAYFIDNIGDVSMWGYEIELSTITAIGRGRLDTTVGYSRQLGEVDSIRSDVSPANAELAGVRLNNLRPENWAATARFRYPLSSSGLLAEYDFFTSLSWVREAGGFQTLPEVGLVALPLDDFSRFSARMGIENDRWTLALQGSNITDEEYILNVDNAGIFRVNNPSYYSVRLSVRFW